MNEIVDQNSLLISMKGLVRRTILRWRYILLVILAASLFGAILSYQKQKNAITSLKEENIDVTESVNAFGSDDLNAVINKAISERIDSEYYYAMNSEIRNLNQNCYKASLLIYVNTKAGDLFGIQGTTEREGNSSSDIEHIFTENITAQSILSYLEEYILTGIDYTALLDELNIENEFFLTELYDVRINGNNLLVDIYYSDGENAEKISNYIIENLSGNSVETIYGPHTLTTHYLGVKKTLYPKSTWTIDTGKVFTDLITLKDNFDGAKSKIVNASSSNQMDSKANAAISIKSIVKNALLYGFMGAFFTIFIIAITLISKKRVLDEEEIKSNYGIDNLLVVEETTYKKHKHNRTDHLIANYGKNITKVKQLSEVLALIDENISFRNPKIECVSVLGEVGSDKIDEICNLLNSTDKHIKYIPIYSLLDKTSRKELSESGGVIVLAGIEQTSFDNLNRDLSIIQSRNVPIIGSVVL